MRHVVLSRKESAQVVSSMQRQRDRGGEQVSKVIIEVLGGVAHIVSAPAGTDVEIIDLDNQEADNE